MTISKTCVICKTPERRRLLELGANDGMNPRELSLALSDVLSAAVINKHLKDHADGLPGLIVTTPVGTVRERVLALQEMQLSEFERRVDLAKRRAKQLNDNLDELEAMGAEGAATAERHDWHEFFNVLDKDNQAAISSILKAQGLTDKREAKTSELKLGLFEAMAKHGGLAPGAISGTPALPALQSGEQNEGNDDDPTD